MLKDATAFSFRPPHIIWYMRWWWDIIIIFAATIIIMRIWHITPFERAIFDPLLMPRYLHYYYSRYWYYYYYYFSCAKIFLRYMFLRRYYRVYYKIWYCDIFTILFSRAIRWFFKTYYYMMSFSAFSARDIFSSRKIYAEHMIFRWCFHYFWYMLFHIILYKDIATYYYVTHIFIRFFTLFLYTSFLSFFIHIFHDIDDDIIYMLLILLYIHIIISVVFVLPLSAPFSHIRAISFRHASPPIFT